MVTLIYGAVIVGVGVGVDVIGVVIGNVGNGNVGVTYGGSTHGGFWEGYSIAKWEWQGVVEKWFNRGVVS